MKRTIQFTPSIKTEWAGTLDYISNSEKLDIMNAMFGYPEIDCQSQFWIKTIKPEFDRQLSDFQDYCESQSRKASQRWERKSMPRDTTAIPRDAVGMPPKISKDKISKDNKGGVGGKEEPDNVSNVSNVNILHLGEMKLVKLTEEENKKVMIKCHGTGRPEPSARYVLAIRKINAWMATGTKATERYKPANKTHYGLFADGNWVWDDIPYDIEKQKKFSETREDWLASINFIKGEQNDNK